MTPQRQHAHRPHSAPTTVQILPEGESRHCPYCNELVSTLARKCWRCHEYFSEPQEDLDDRAYQFARREVLQDCVDDIRKWITRIGFGSVLGIAAVAMLGTLRFEDLLASMVAERVQETAGPVLEKSQEKLDETDEVLDGVQDSLRLAKHRIAQFDSVTDQLAQAEVEVLKIEQARQELEDRAAELGEQFGQLEHRFINAKRELRGDREQRMEEMLAGFSNHVITYNQLVEVLSHSADPASGRMLEALAPLGRRHIQLIGPFSLSAEKPTVVFTSAVKLSWQLGLRDFDRVNYRVYYDTQPDFRGEHSREATTRMTHHVLPVDFPHGLVYWRVEAVDDHGHVIATSNVGHFEHYSDTIDRIRSTGVVRVGVAYSAQGEFAYFDEAERRLTGYDIELSRWLASRVLPGEPGIRPVFVNYDWRQLLKSVSRNEVDFIISTITITADREEEYGIRFSSPYYKTSQACVVLKESGLRAGKELRGRRLAVQTGTSSETVAEAFTEATRLYRSSSSEDSFDALLKGEVDAIITDFDFAQGYVRKLGHAAAVIPLQESDFPDNYAGTRSEEYGIAVAKPETYLLTRLNNAIDAAKRANILESLRLRFVTGRHDAETIAAPLPQSVPVAVKTSTVTPIAPTPLPTEPTAEPEIAGQPVSANPLRR